MLIFASSASVAEDITFSDSVNDSVTSNQVNDSLLQLFDLNKEEWQKYTEVLKGPRGLWSPNIHPVMALGMRKGISVSERNKLAKKMAKIRFARLKREIAFERAVRAEGLKLYGHIPLFVVDEETTTFKVNEEKKNLKYQLFADINCSICKSYISNWISSDNSFELHVLGDKKAIGTFAQNMGISPLLVPSKIQINQITKKQLAALGISNLPQIRELETE